MKKAIVVLVGVFALLIFSVALLTTKIPVSAEGKKDYVEGKVLVKFKEGTPQDEIDQTHKKLGGRIKEIIPHLNVQVVEVKRGVGEAVSAYAKESKVEYAEPDYIAELLDYFPNDQYFAEGRQWALYNYGQVFDTERGLKGTAGADVSAPKAWEVIKGSPSVYIAILDTGVNQTHEDLKDKLVVGKMKDFSGSSIEDQYGHGTHVAGIAVASTDNSGIGVAGTGFNSGLMISKVCSDSGSCPYSWVANGIVWASDNGANVINMSLGGPQKSRTLESAVNYAWTTKNVVLVAAAGNSNNPSATYPAYYTSVIAVAATDSNDKKASFSSYGKWVDVAAPGVEVFSTFPNHAFVLEDPTRNREQNYGYGSGTSMSTPVVAGIAGLVWSTPLSGNSNAKVRAQIEKNADTISGTGKYWVWGRVNAYKAVSIRVN